MKSRILVLVLLVIAFSAPSVALAANCSIWNWQSDGVYWQTCINDDGSQHCYQATDETGANAKEVSC